MRHPFCKTFSFRRLPHGTTSPTAPLQLRVFFTRLSVSQFSCRCVFDTTFGRPPFFVFIICVERFLIFICFRMCSVLPGASSAGTAQPGWLSSYWSPPDTVSSATKPNQTIFPFTPTLAVRTAVSLLQSLKSGLLLSRPSLQP